MSELTQQLEKLLADAVLELAAADDQALRELEIKLLGRKGEMNNILCPCHRSHRPNGRNWAQPRIG